MARIVVFIAAFAMVLSSCAKLPGFKAENYDYVAAAETPTVHAEPAEEPLPGTVIRNKKRVSMKPKPDKNKGKNKSDQPNKKLTMMADVQIDGKSLGEVEFTGTQTDSKVLWEPVDPKLKEDLKAQMTCTSDDGTCTDAFIDVIYRDKGVLYIDQILAFPKADDSSPSVPAPTPSIQPEKQDEAFEFIDMDRIKYSGHVGISNDDARLKFNMAPPVRKDGSRKEDRKPNPYLDPKDDKDDDDLRPPAPPVAPAPAPGLPPQVTPPVGKDGNKDEPKVTPKPDDKKDGGKGEEDVTAQSPMKALEKFKKKDQAVNWPFTYKDPESKKTVNGRLNRGINFRDLVASIPGINFQVSGQTVHNFGTYGLAQVITSISQSLKTILPGRFLRLTSISKVNGGVSNLHTSHQNGTDIDVLYMRNNEDLASDIVTGNRVTNNFLVKEQWLLTKKAFQTGQVQVIFMDRVVKKALCDYAVTSGDYRRGEEKGAIAEMLRNIMHADGHQNHFHIRANCSADDSACQEIPYKTRPVGC